MKKGDLVAKWWIITDPQSGLAKGSPDQSAHFLPFLNPLRPIMMEMHQAILLLYSLKTYAF
jgi:hypothetical protein